MPLTDSATPTLNSFGCASAGRPSPAPPGVASTAAPRSRRASQRTPRVVRILVMRCLQGVGSVQQRLALAAVQSDERAVHEARPVGRHEDGDVGDLLGRADAAERDAALGALLRFVRADLAHLGDARDQTVPALRGYG